MTEGYKVNIAVCDDDANYIEDIKRHLKQYSFEHGLTFNIYEFTSSAAVLASKTPFDIAYLDIEMQGKNGLEVGKALQAENPETVLMYITAYSHYLDDALDLGATRFFDKPIDSARFYAGLDKAIAKLDGADEKFYLSDGSGGVSAVMCRDIVLVEIYGKRTRLVTRHGDFISNESIKCWRERLGKSCFVSPHNSYIINTDRITYYCKEYVILDGKYNVPIAYSRRTEFKRKFMMLMGE